MGSETPPTTRWWAQNCPRICFNPFQLTYLTVIFDTQWSLLRSVYEIMSSYERQYPPAMQCSEETEKIFRNTHLFGSTEIHNEALDSLETSTTFQTSTSRSELSVTWSRFTSSVQTKTIPSQTGMEYRSKVLGFETSPPDVTQTLLPLMYIKTR